MRALVLFRNVHDIANGNSRNITFIAGAASRGANGVVFDGDIFGAAQGCVDIDCAITNVHEINIVNR